MIILSCPECKTTLSKTKNFLQCTNCLKNWNIKDGVPILTNSSQWYPKEHMSREQFDAFLQNVKAKGWDKSIEIAMDSMEKPEGFHALAFDEERRNLSTFLPVKKDAIVLDYGCGVGGISFNLAKSCKHVYSIDQSIFRTRFIKSRYEHTAVSNITAICAGSSRFLPFPKDSFDIVVMNGVLEWMPISMDGNPYQIQINALTEINRVLKKGGALYLAIENRFGYRYVIQRKGDSHNQKKKKVQYITLFPRFLSNIYSHIIIGQPYRCYLYSYFGYKRMLKKTNFSKCDFYFPYPDHNKLNYIVPLNGFKTVASSTTQMLSSSSISKKERINLTVLSRFGLLKYMAQDYSIIATK